MESRTQPNLREEASILRNDFSDLPLIFDLDGTLVDSANQMYRALNMACIEADVDLIPKKIFIEKLGLPIKSILSDLNLATSDEQELIFSFRKKLEIEILKANPLFSGVEEFLQSARDLGHPIAIATSKPTYLAKLVVMNSPLSKFIDYVQGTDDFPAKPAPDVILKCLSFFNKSQGVMFGDRIEDMLAASSAGIPSIGIAQGFHSISDLVSAGAEIAFDDFFELQKNLQDWSSSPQFHSHLKLPDSFT